MGEAQTRKDRLRRARAPAAWLVFTLVYVCACGHPPAEMTATNAGTSAANPSAPAAEEVGGVTTESIPASTTDTIRARYPSEWKVAVPEGTRLAAFRDRLDQEIDLLPEQDLEDRTPLPIWFRVYLRKTFPDLATSGPYQYPRTANRILQSFLADPDSELLGEL